MHSVEFLFVYGTEMVATNVSGCIGHFVIGAYRHETKQEAYIDQTLHS